MRQGIHTKCLILSLLLNSTDLGKLNNAIYTRPHAYKAWFYLGHYKSYSKYSFWVILTSQYHSISSNDFIWNDIYTLVRNGHTVAMDGMDVTKYDHVRWTLACRLFALVKLLRNANELTRLDQAVCPRADQIIGITLTLGPDKGHI